MNKLQYVICFWILYIIPYQTLTGYANSKIRIIDTEQSTFIFSVSGEYCNREIEWSNIHFPVLPLEVLRGVFQNGLAGYMWQIKKSYVLFLPRLDSHRHGLTF